MMVIKSVPWIVAFPLRKAGVAGSSPSAPRPRRRPLTPVPSPSHAVNLLSNLPVSCLDALIEAPARGGLPEYDGKNMEAVQVLLDFMEKRIDKVSPEPRRRLSSAFEGQARVTSVALTGRGRPAGPAFGRGAFSGKNTVSSLKEKFKSSTSGSWEEHLAPVLEGRCVCWFSGRSRHPRFIRVIDWLKSGHALVCRPQLTAD